MFQEELALLFFWGLSVWGGDKDWKSGWGQTTGGCVSVQDNKFISSYLKNSNNNNNANSYFLEFPGRCRGKVDRE